jgi:hypothetical protein
VRASPILSPHCRRPKSAQPWRSSLTLSKISNWEGFRAAFDDNATVFYPRAFAERAIGRAEFEKTFKIVFEQIRAGRTVPPYMHIEPRGLTIQMLGDTAIATFHLDDRAGFLNRRTIVLHKTTAGWKIVHLHASEVALPQGRD